MTQDYSRPVNDKSIKDVAASNRAFWDAAGATTVSGEEGPEGTGAGATEAPKPPETAAKPAPKGYGPNTGFLKGGQISDESIEEERADEDKKKSDDERIAPMKGVSFKKRAEIMGASARHHLAHGEAGKAAHYAKKAATLGAQS